MCKFLKCITYIGNYNRLEDQTYNKELAFECADANATRTKGNVVVYLDKRLVEKSKELGFNLSNTFYKPLKTPNSRVLRC